MGRAVIAADLGGARYELDVDHDRAVADARLARLAAEEATARAALPGLTAAHATSLATWQLAAAALEAALLARQAAAGTDPGAEEAAANRVAAVAQDERTAYAGLLQATSLLRRATLTADSLARQHARLIARLGPATVAAQAWCVDYTPHLTGPVGTVDLARQSPRYGEDYHVYPGGAADTDSAYVPSRDGRLVQVATLDPAAAFWNYAILPGLETWRPRYRVGRVTAVDATADTLDVELDASPVGHQHLEANQTPTLAAVPADYQGTGADNYQVGERVVVGFGVDPADPTGGTRWTRPHVLGYWGGPPYPHGDRLWLFDGYTITAPAWMVPPLSWEFGNALFADWATTGRRIDWPWNQGSAAAAADYWFEAAVDPHQVSVRVPDSPINPPPGPDVQLRTARLLTGDGWDRDRWQWGPTTPAGCAPQWAGRHFAWLSVRATDALANTHTWPACFPAAVGLHVEFDERYYRWGRIRAGGLAQFYVGQHVEVLASEWLSHPVYEPMLSQTGLVWRSAAAVGDPAEKPLMLARVGSVSYNAYYPFLAQTYIQFAAGPWWVKWGHYSSPAGKPHPPWYTP